MLHDVAKQNSFATISLVLRSVVATAIIIIIIAIIKNQNNNISTM